MNDPILSSDPSFSPENEFEHGEQHHRFTDVEGEIRQHPLETVVVAVGVGLLLGILVRSLQPQRPENRVVSLLADLEDRLERLASPALNKASRLAENTTDCVRRTGDRVSDLHLDRKLRGWGRKLRNYLPG